MTYSIIYLHKARDNSLLLLVIQLDHRPDTTDSEYASKTYRDTYFYLCKMQYDLYWALTLWQLYITYYRILQGQTVYILKHGSIFF